MPRKLSSSSAETTLEAPKEPEKTSETPKRTAKREQTLTLKLLRNSFVEGSFAKKGKTFTFLRPDALRRLQRTSDTWEAVSSS